MSDTVTIRGFGPYAVFHRGRTRLRIDEEVTSHPTIPTIMIVIPKKDAPLLCNFRPKFQQEPGDLCFSDFQVVVERIRRQGVFGTIKQGAFGDEGPGGFEFGLLGLGGLVLVVGGLIAVAVITTTT